MKTREISKHEALIVIGVSQAMYWGIILACWLAGKWGLW